MYIPLLIAMLFGCQPRTWEVCYSNQELQDDICNNDRDNDEEQLILNECAYISGFNQTEGCANIAKKYNACVQEVLLSNPDCEDIQEDIADLCSELAGKYDGCLADD